MSSVNLKKLSFSELKKHNILCFRFIKKNCLFRIVWYNIFDSNVEDGPLHKAEVFAYERN